ncbi:ribonuclease P protein subunit p14-like [Photinus pyralis]|uniref:ribonuclease P protein subunit p14-like n=1 Tax=Photinus pyralis TaxID=7054 RepID=UPI00126781AA|nr:ribonuclease P protein subunit p14-like [Photinus pyralis]
MYYYLDVSLVLADNQEITPALFKNHILTSVKQVFGEIGAAVPFDVLKYDSTQNRAILRVPRDHYVKFRGSLTLAGYYQGVLCAYTVHKASPLLLSLLGDSRSYVH